MPTSLSEIQAVTEKEFVPAIQNEFATRKPLIKIFNLVADGQWKVQSQIAFPKSIGPGELQRSVKANSYEVHIPILLANPGKAKSYSGFGDFTLEAPSSPNTAAYDYASIGRPIALTKEQMEDSKAAVVSYLTNALIEAVGDCAEAVETQLCGDGSGNGGLDLDGLRAVVTASNGTVGGLIQASYANWQPYRYTTSITGVATTPMNLLGPMVDCWDNAVFGSPPTLILTTVIGKGLYQKAMLAAGLAAGMPWIVQPGAKDSMLVKLGIEHVFFNGAPLIAGDAVYTDGTSHYMYFLNLEHLAFKTKSKQRIEVDKWEPLTVIARRGIASFCGVRGVFAARSLKSQAIITDLRAS